MRSSVEEPGVARDDDRLGHRVGEPREEGERGERVLCGAEGHERPRLGRTCGLVALLLEARDQRSLRARVADVAERLRDARAKREVPERLDERGDGLGIADLRERTKELIGVGGVDVNAACA